MIPIHIFGGAFWDIFIEEVIEDGALEADLVHAKRVRDMPGGSGLNIALGLHLLGHRAVLHSAVGNDLAGRQIAGFLENQGMSLSGLQKVDRPTGLFIARGQKPIAVRVPPKSLQSFPVVDDAASAYAMVLATEIDVRILERVASTPWKGLVVDWGPKGGRVPPDTKTAPLFIGTTSECKACPCHIVKMGPNGARWGERQVDGTKKPLPYPVGAGDLFDVVVMDGVARGIEPELVLNEAVRLSQIAASIPGSSRKPLTLFAEGLDDDGRIEKPFWHHEGHVGLSLSAKRKGS